MKRRTCLWLSFANTAALTLPSLNCSNENTALEKTLSQPAVLSRVADADVEATIRKI